MIYGSATLLLCCWRGGGFAALLRFGSAPGPKEPRGVSEFGHQAAALSCIYIRLH